MAARKKNPKKPSERNLTRELSLLLAKRVLPDLSERVRDEPAVRAALGKQFEREKRQGRTADNVEEWTARTLEQVGVAWILSCVFIRTLEDRGYLTQRRLAGDGASDSEHVFFELFPSLTQRDYLLAVFRELSRLPGGEDVLGPKHNPAWRLAPRAEVVRELLGFFREASAEGELVWRFGGSDTRFLGDLYQDISEGVRERYALLQTPEFVEEFILDLTLEPAIQEFGLEEVRLLDPTCGSGHFLLGAFRRLFETRQRKAPGVAVKEHAGQALAQVYGVDINPYAAAVARFRLVLTYLEAAGIEKLRSAPRMTANVVVADSLLFAADEQTLSLASRSDDAAAWGEGHWQLEDPDEAQRLFSRRFHAVVGNPPYVTCKDPVLREKYREAYVSAAGKYALAAPFTERFFQLATEGGFVGMINANSFMKREFGKKLIELVLPKVELTHVIDVAGAYIPGHATPTVLLFGRNRAPLSDKVGAVMGKRGEPETPANPEQGLVWSSIRAHSGDVGFENDFISVAAIPRNTLSTHPWSLGGGGAAALKELLEHRGERRLEDIAESIGISSVTGEDDVYLLPAGVARRLGIENTRSMVTGEVIRDWSFFAEYVCLFPYDSDLHLEPIEKFPRMARLLWMAKPVIRKRKRFGVPMLERGLSWYELQELYADKLRTPLAIAFAFVATHNHFVLDRGGKVFKQSAPIIKLKGTAVEEDHLALLACLNSSCVGFFLRQQCQEKQMMGGDGIRHSDKTTVTYEFGAAGVGRIPLPPLSASARARAISLASELLRLNDVRSRLGSAVLAAAIASVAELEQEIAIAEKESSELLRRSVGLQEDLDWLVYHSFGLVKDDCIGTIGPLSLGERPYEVCIRERDVTADGFPIRRPSLHPEHAQLYATRERAIAESSEVRLLEGSWFKRRWIGVQGRFNHGRVSLREDIRALSVEQIMNRVDDVFRARVAIAQGRTLLAQVEPSCAVLVAWMRGDMAEDFLLDAVDGQAVPYLASLRLGPTGLEKRQLWERCWNLQRREDAGDVCTIDVPPKYEPKDFRRSEYFAFRGKLDIPKERFISYPGAEKDDDPTPLYGWAGWDHLQQATALAGLYHERKTEAGWPAERLVPLLAGLLELVPWLKQWHNDPTEDLGGEGAGDWYERYVEAEARALGKSLQDLRDWRPPKGRKK